MDYPVLPDFDDISDLLDYLAHPTEPSDYPDDTDIWDPQSEYAAICGAHNLQGFLHIQLILLVVLPLAGREWSVPWIILFTLTLSNTKCSTPCFTLTLSNAECSTPAPMSPCLVQLGSTIASMQTSATLAPFTLSIVLGAKNGIFALTLTVQFASMHMIALLAPTHSNLPVNRANSQSLHIVSLYIYGYFS